MTVVLPISAEPAALAKEDARPGRWRRMPTKAKAGAILLGLFVLAAIIGPFVTPYDPSFQNPSPALSLHAPYGALPRGGAVRPITRWGEPVMHRPQQQVTAYDEELHDLRKLGKRARYASELARNRTVAGSAKKLQDVLGEHQDSTVAESRLRALREVAPTDQAVVAGRLREREHLRQSAARADWPAAWRRLDRASR